MPKELILNGSDKPTVADILQHHVVQNEAAHQAYLLVKPKKDAQALLEKHDAKGYTRAWETSVAPLVAAETLPEYDQAIFDEKKAARAVVVG